MKVETQYLERILINEYPNFIGEFNIGLSTKEIIDFSSGKNLNFDKNIIELYNWKNGINQYNSDILLLSLFPFGIFTSLELSYSYYKTCCLKENLWNENLFPIFHSGMGDYFLINIGENYQNDPFVYFYSPALLAIPEVTIFDSITILIQSITDAYSAKILDRDFTSKLIVSDEYENFISSQNKNSQYWKF